MSADPLNDLDIPVVHTVFAATRGLHMIAQSEQVTPSSCSQRFEVSERIQSIMALEDKTKSPSASTVKIPIPTWNPARNHAEAALTDPPSTSCFDASARTLLATHHTDQGIA